jgi:hypothetical protein
MAIVDERGRLFGRLNLFDAIVAVLLLWMIPIAYGAYLLFRTPVPTLAAVEPATIVYGTNMKIRVRGTNFVPYLRVSVGRYQGMTFKFNDTTDAEVDLVDVPPGVYDVILYDNSQERDRIPNGLTIAPSALPEATLTVVGTFGNLTAAQAAAIKPGMTIEGIGTIERVGTPRSQVQRVFVRPGMVEVPVASAQMVSATLRLACFVRSAQGQPECVGGGFSVQPTTLLFLDMPFGKVPFQIDQIRSVQPLQPVRVTVRFAGEQSVLATMKAGDADFGDVRNELSATATIDSVGAVSGGTRDAQLTVQAQQGADGWLYANAPLRMGSRFVLRNQAYEAQGTVIAVEARPAPGQ